MTKHLTPTIFDSQTRSGIRQEFRNNSFSTWNAEILGEFRYMSVAKGPETSGEFRYGVMSKRSGTTILEVLFAIMVVIVGLLGIASIIPLAARNANESNTHNNAQSLGPSWLHAFTARGLNVSNSFERTEAGYNWVWLRDYPGAPPNNTETFQRFRKSYLGFGDAAAVGVTGTLNQSASNAAVTAGQIVCNWGYQSVCIDPYFFTDPDVRQRISNTGLSSRVGAFRAAVFPYYEDGYNPLSDSAQPADAWQDQPRMIRVGLSNNNATNALVASKLINDIFASTDDLSMSTYNVDPATGERVKDDSIPAMRLFQTTTVSGNTIPLGASPASEYSWIITASPREPLEVPVATVNATTDDYTVSLVVMHRRDSLYIPSTITPVPGEKEDKPQGERLVWVAPISGSFMNGNGGRVRLMANEFTDDTVRIGDWIMLGRHFMVNPAVQNQRYSYYRWYRIVAVDQESRHDLLSNLSPSTDPYGNSASQMVWSRDVVLEGPDFNFASAVGGVVTPTTGTLVSGVVTVLERKISIE